MIYVNGDSHSAGADIIPGICFADDDPRFLAYGRRPHPEAIVETYGYKIAQTFNQGFFCDAESGSSNYRIIRTTRDFIEQTKDTSRINIIIGWTSWEREEWQDPDHRETYYQVTASGTDSVAPFMQEEYKRWVIRQTPEELKRKKEKWQKTINEFSNELTEQNINHYFFHVDDYTKYLMEQGYRTTNGHFGADGHTEWANYLGPHIRKAWWTGAKLQKELTETKKRIIVNTVKQEFTGFSKDKRYFTE